MAHQLLFDRRKRLALARFSGSFGRRDVEGMDVEVLDFVDRNGACDVVVDFTTVTDFDVSADYLRTRGKTPRAMKGFRRALVAPQLAMFGLLRLYGLHQDALDDGPAVVRTLDEAYAVLGIEAPDFEPVQASAPQRRRRPPPTPTPAACTP